MLNFWKIVLWRNYNMAYLYELEGVYAHLQSMDLDDDLFKDTLESIDFQNELEKNIEYFIKMKRNSEAEASSYKSEKLAFEKKQKQAEARAKKYGEIIKNAMELTGQDKISTSLFKVSLRKTQSVSVLDLTQLPVEFIKTKQEPMKTEIKNAIRSGREITGVELVEGRSLVVK